MSLAGCATRPTVDPAFLRQSVAYETKEAAGAIVVDPANHFGIPGFLKFALGYKNVPEKGFLLGNHLIKRCSHAYCLSFVCEWICCKRLWTYPISDPKITHEFCETLHSRATGRLLCIFLANKLGYIIMDNSPLGL